MSVTSLGVRVAGVVLELGGFKKSELLVLWSNSWTRGCATNWRANGARYLQLPKPIAAKTFTVCRLEGQLTVGQNTLQRVDTVQHNDA